MGDIETRVHLKGRDERWYGSLGYYSPGGGRIHVVADEGVQSFETYDDFLNWKKVVYEIREDGYLFLRDDFLLYFSYGGQGERRYIRYDLWKILIDEKIDNSVNSESHMEVDSSCNPSVYRKTYSVPKGKGVGGVNFSSKAVEILDDKGANIKKASEAVQSDSCSSQNSRGITYKVCQYYDKGVGRSIYLKIIKGKVVAVN